MFLNPHQRGLDSLRQAVEAVHPAFYILQKDSRVITRLRLNLDGCPAFTCRALDFLNAGQIRHDIFNRDNNGFLHLLGRGAPVGDPDFHLVRVEHGKNLNREPVDDAVDPHEDDENHQQIGRHCITGKPGYHPVDHPLGLPFPLPYLLFPLPGPPLPLGGPGVLGAVSPFTWTINSCSLVA